VRTTGASDPKNKYLGSRDRGVAGTSHPGSSRSKLRKFRPPQITAKELAGFLCVAEVTIFKHAAAGRIPSFRVGTCVRFDPRAVANWLRKM
jgi:excisionase family DNA binding protein